VLCLLVCGQAGFSALHLAAQNGHNESARILLFAGCSPDHRNGVCCSASHRCVLVLIEYYQYLMLSLIAIITDYFGDPGSSVG